MEKANILVVDDDKEIAELVGIHLREEGYEVYKAYSGKEALKIFKQERIDLVILDVMMPVMDGNQVCSKIRDTSAVPIIMLSAKDAEMDMVSSLYQGADDYVTKPFAPMELIARVNSQLRRYAKYLALAGGQPAQPEEHVYAIGGLELNEDTVSLTVDGRPVRLTPLEFKILALLMKNPGRVFSAVEIYERVWNVKAITTDTIMVHIRNIREKIEYNPREPKYLKVVWGIGYKIEK